MVQLLYYLYVPASELSGKGRMTDMTKTESAAVEKLKSIIVENGREYLYKEPQAVYSKLLREKNIGSCTAGVVGYALLTRTGKKSTDSLEEDVAKLGLRKALSSSLCLILSTVFSPSFSSDLEDMKKKAIDEFCRGEWKIKLSGSAVWRAKNGFRMDCKYRYTMTLRVVDTEQVEKDIVSIMKKDAFSAEDILKEYTSMLDKVVQDDFEEYCCSDDYYEPCVEEYDSESGFDVMDGFLDKYGLEGDDVEYWSDTDY